MNVLFLRQTQIRHTTYVPGDRADIDADDANDLIRRGLVSYLGEGDLHSGTWNDIAGPVSGINPAGALDAPAVDTTETGWPGSFLFSGSADKLIAGYIQLGHDWEEGSPIRPHIHWMLTADSASAVTWEFYYRLSNIGDAAGTWVGPVSGTLAVSHGNTANVQALTTFGEIDMTGYTLSAIVAWRLYRRGSTDANNDDARLLSLDFHRRANGTGSIQEYLKGA
jgi:hypothetical protein